MAKPERTRYSPWVKEQVRKRYALCRTTADKEALAKELSIVDANGNPSVPKLYNLASRLNATGGQTVDHEEFVADESRLLRREDPETTKLSAESVRYLKNEFGRRTIELIAAHINHSETCVLYHARHLKRGSGSEAKYLRKIAKHWDARKVAAWFGMTLDELKQLQVEGIDIVPFYNKRGRLVHEIVSTTSLGRWLAVEGNKQKLLERDADKFFILEIEETMRDLIDDTNQFELCKFLSHGHVCLNTYAENSHGLFCTNNERYDAGNDPRCAVRSLQIYDLRPKTDEL